MQATCVVSAFILPRGVNLSNVLKEVLTNINNREQSEDKDT